MPTQIPLHCQEIVGWKVESPEQCIICTRCSKGGVLLASTASPIGRHSKCRQQAHLFTETQHYYDNPVRRRSARPDCIELCRRRMSYGPCGAKSGYNLPRMEKEILRPRSVAVGLSTFRRSIIWLRFPRGGSASSLSKTPRQGLDLRYENVSTTSDRDMACLPHPRSDGWLLLSSELSRIAERQIT